jgi:four helix bundle protein
MAAEDLKILRPTEEMADLIWASVTRWDEFTRDTIGKQLTRAADSIGANIAESAGRFNFGEKLQFLYYARGSLFETKYWLNRAQNRKLLPPTEAQVHITRLTDLARQLNAFVSGLKAVRQTSQKPPHTLREESAEYDISTANPLFSSEDLTWLAS